MWKRKRLKNNRLHSPHPCFVAYPLLGSTFRVRVTLKLELALVKVRIKFDLELKLQLPCDEITVTKLPCNHMCDKF